MGKIQKTFVVPVAIGCALLLAACGSFTTPTTTTKALTATTGASLATTTSSAEAKSLAVTPAVRQSLLDAAAALHQLPASDYAGLAPGRTYYAFDPTTHRYYAAAALVPSPKSIKAQVGTQDDGAYSLFTRAAGTSAWTVFSDGLGGVQGSRCPVVLPASVLAVWGWSANSCYPPT